MSVKQVRYYTQNKTNYKKDYIYFDTIEETRIARARQRQLVKTVLRKGAKLIIIIIIIIIMTLLDNEITGRTSSSHSGPLKLQIQIAKIRSKNTVKN